MVHVMKTLHLQRSSETSMLHQLFLHLGGALNVIGNESVLIMDNEIAKGTIKQFILRNGISCFKFNITFYDNILIKYVSQKNISYDFIYSLESSLRHNFGREGKIRKIEKFQTGIFCSGQNLNSILHFAKNIKHNLSLITVCAFSKKNNEEVGSVFVQKLQSAFKLTEANNSIAYIGSYNLKIAEKIQQLKETYHKGIVRSLLIEAIIITILGLQIQQHSDDLKKKNSNYGSLTKNEMATIRRISENIKKHPENEYSIISICLESGLSKAKLQEGFKLMHDLTVTQYIRDVRILAAEHLIKTTDLNISEIVYSIGLTSRSYFSKIFKEKYKCSPKNYQENNNYIQF